MSTATNASMRAAPPAGRYCATFLFFWSVFTLTNCGYDTSEARYHYQLAEHIFATGSIGFAEPMNGVFTVGPDGRTYISHEFGNTFFLLPIAALNHSIELQLTASGASSATVDRVKQFIPPFLASLYTAITATLYSALLRRHFGLSWHASFTAAILFSLGTFVWTYSRVLFDGVLCSALLLGSFFCLMEYCRDRRNGWLVGSFTLAGIAVDTRLSMATCVVAGFAFLLALHRRELRTRFLPAAAVAIMTLLPFAAWQMWFNHLRTGNPLISPVQTAQYAENNGLNGSLSNGLVGLLFSPGKSIFVFAPLALLVPILFPKFARRFPLPALYVTVQLSLWFVLHAKLHSWYGAWGWGPRHFVTVIGLFLLPAFACWPDIVGRRRLRLPAFLLSAGGGVLAIASLMSCWHYRMKINECADLLSDECFVWSIDRSQAVDILKSAAHNLAVMAGVAVPDFLRNATDLHVWSVNTINMWWMTLPRAGIPIGFVGIAAGTIAITGAAALLRALRAADDHAEKLTPPWQWPIVRSLRPTQWLKNLACFAGLIFSGQLFEPKLAAYAALSFVAFSAASSAVYLCNDLVDRTRDRLNPRTADRPIASGAVSAVQAAGIAFLLSALAFLLCACLGIPCAVVLGSYIAVNIAYTFRLKTMAIADILCIAVGFVLRVLFGVYAVRELPSPWIVLCIFFLALFLVLGKRRSEIAQLGDQAADIRPVLKQYPIAFVELLLATTAALTILTYTLYTVLSTEHDRTIVITVAPVVFCIFRYFQRVMIDQCGDSPENVLLSDRMLWIGAAAWLTLSVLSVYSGIALFAES